MDAVLDRRTARRTRVGLVAGGLGAYWPQFPELLPQLRRGTGHRAGELAAVADLPGPELRVV